MRRLLLSLTLLATGCTATAAGPVTPGAAPSAKPAAVPSAKASASASASPSPEAPALPAPGDAVDAAFWAANHPAVAKGTTWTYETAFAYQSRPGDETPYDTLMALTDVAGAKLTFMVTDKAPGGGASDKVTTAEGRVGPLVPGDDPAWIYHGAEDVTVPAGTFTGALKLKAIDKVVAQEIVVTGGTLWLVPGTGVVKLMTNGDYHLRQELKRVAKP